MPQVRRYPRVPYEACGEMEVRLAEHHLAIPVTVRSVSCEGAGVALVDRGHRLRPGTSVTVRFSGDDHSFVLPARVAWCARGEQKTGPFDMGVRFQLGAAQPRMRQSYARWIVSLIRELRGQ